MEKKYSSQERHLALEKPLLKPWLRMVLTSFLLREAKIVSKLSEVQVLTLDEEKEVRWVGGFQPFFRGEHCLLFEDIGNGKTRLIHGENLSGMFGKLFYALRHNEIEKSYKAFNEGLANRAIENKHIKS